MSGPIGNCFIRVRFLALTEDDNNPFNLKQIIEFDLNSDEKQNETNQQISSETRFFNELTDNFSSGMLPSRLQFSLGYGSIELKDNQDAKLEVIIKSLTKILKKLKQHWIYHHLQKVLIQIRHAGLPVIQQILEFIAPMKQLQEIDLESARPFSQEENNYLKECIVTKLTNLKRIDYDFPIEKDKGIENNNKKSNRKFLKEKQLNIDKCGFQFRSSVQELDILQLFPNLLSLHFTLNYQTTLIDELLFRLSHVAPQLTALYFVAKELVSPQLRNLEQLNHLSYLVLNLKSPLDKESLNLSKMKSLETFSLSCVDPLGYFGEFSNLPILKKLLLSNKESFKKTKNQEIEEIKNEKQKKQSKTRSKASSDILSTSEVKKEILKLRIEKFKKALLSHKCLSSVTLEAFGYDNSAGQCFIRDIEVISVVASKLRKLALKLTNFQHINNFKETKHQGIVNGLCALLNCCTNETEINFEIKLDSLSIQDKLDMALALQRIPYPELFTLNSQNILKNLQQKHENNPYKEVNLQEGYPLLITLGLIGSVKHLSSKDICFNFDIMEDILKKKNLPFQTGLKKLLQPFTRVKLSQRDQHASNDYPTNLSKILSPNLIKLELFTTVQLADINKLTEQYPSLQQINSFVDVFKDLTDNLDKQKHNSIRNICIRYELPGAFQSKVMKYFEIEGHFVNVFVSPFVVIDFNLTKKIFDGIIASQYRVLIHFNACVLVNTNLISLPYQTVINSFSQEIQTEVLKLRSFFSWMAAPLTINPHYVYLDLLI